MIAPNSRYSLSDEACMHIAPMATGEAKVRLADLENEKYLPKVALLLVHDFGKFLVGYIGERTDPLGFVDACERALVDMRKRDAKERQVPTELCGYSHWVYEALWAYIPLIAHAIFPHDFARGVSVVVQKKGESMPKKKEQIPQQHVLDLGIRGNSGNNRQQK